jgi:integrase
MKTKLTPAFVASPPVPSKDREVFWEGGGLGLMVTAKGHKSFVVQYRTKAGQSRRETLKPGLSLQDARREAKKIVGDVAKGGDPLGDRRKAAGSTLKAVVEEYYERELPKIRSGHARKLVIERLVLPVLGTRRVSDIKRSDIVRLLDGIEKKNGPHQATAVLAFLSKIFNWHSARDDEFLTPIRRGMARTKLKESARDRVLSDDEVRAVWKAAEEFSGPYGYLVRFLLLTATRRQEGARMLRSELHGDDWIIPAVRMKGKLEHVVPLSPAAKVIIETMPYLSEFVFTSNGRRATRNFADDKRKLDATSGVTGWRLHDLRRTARSLMSRAGVDPDTAERCLAHTIGGVRGVYDRYAYHREKKAAFAALALQVERIVNPIDNIVSIRRQ